MKAKHIADGIWVENTWTQDCLNVFQEVDGLDPIRIGTIHRGDDGLWYFGGAHGPGFASLEGLYRVIARRYGQRPATKKTAKERADGHVEKWGSLLEMLS